MNTMKWGIVGAVSIVLIAVLMAINPFVVVQTGTRGLLLDWGQVEGILEPGLHFRTPIAEHVIDMDVTTRKVEVPAAAASSDLQNTSTKIAVNYNRDPAKVDYIYTTFHNNEDDVLIAPAIQDTVKSIVAQYTAVELITKRELVKNEIEAALRKRLANNHIMVTAVAITNFSFSEAFESAIEEKVTAEQKALAAKNKLAQIEYEAQQTVTTAKAQAEAIKIQAQAITQQGGHDYVQLQAINKWDGALPQQFVPGSAIPFLDITGRK